MTEETQAATPAVLAQINCGDLRRVLPFKAHDDMRYYLNGIFVEPIVDGCLLVATDGHRLAVIKSSRSFSSRPVIVRVTQTFAGVIHNAKYDADVIVSSPKANARLVTPTGKELFVQAGEATIDGKYPEWRKPIPLAADLVDGLPGAVNPAYLRSLLDAADEATGPKRGCVYFQHKASDAPGSSVIVARSDNHPELVMALMPMRYDRKPLPDWVAPPDATSTEQEAAA